MAKLTVKIKKSDERSLEFDLEGSDQTMASAIVDKLREDPHVTFAAYRVAHPLIGTPTLRLTTDESEKPIDAVNKAIKELIIISKKLMEDAKKIS